jgi:hypothetical protein
MLRERNETLVVVPCWGWYQKKIFNTILFGLFNNNIYIVWDARCNFIGLIYTHLSNSLLVLGMLFHLTHLVTISMVYPNASHAYSNYHYILIHVFRWLAWSGFVDASVVHYLRWIPFLYFQRQNLVFLTLSTYTFF